MESQTRQDRELLRRARAGESECFGMLFRRHHAIVLAFLARRSDQPEVAADLLAETFAALLVVVRDLSRELPANPIGWLLLTARNLLIDSHRHGLIAAAARHKLALDPVVLDDPDIGLITEAGRSEDLLRQLHELLPADQAEALLARVVDELDYAAIARRSRTSEPVVRKRVSRALATLRTTFER